MTILVYIDVIGMALAALIIFRSQIRHGMVYAYRYIINDARSRSVDDFGPR